MNLAFLESALDWFVELVTMLQSAVLKHPGSGMHIIVGILSVLGALAFWYYRIKFIGGAAGEVVDAAGKMRGAYNRRKFRKKVEGSPLTAIEDVQTAASVMAVAVMVEKGPLSREAEDALRNELEETINVQDPVEMATFSKWVVEQAVEPDNISRKFSKLWISDLSESDRREFVRMVRRLSAVDGEPNQAQLRIISTLEERLSLQK